MHNVALIHPDLPERFASKVAVDADSGCWLWTAGKDSHGYAAFRVDGKQWGAHRWAYITIVGPVADHLKLDHECRTRHCVNPFHLEPVTNRENTIRGIGPSAVNASRSECIRGHEFSTENTRIYKGSRVCRTCERDRSRARRNQDA